MLLLACLFGVNVLALSLYTMCLGNSVTNSVFIKKISLSGLSLLAFSVLSKKKISGFIELDFVSCFSVCDFKDCSLVLHVLCNIVLSVQSFGYVMLVCLLEASSALMVE